MKDLKEMKDAADLFRNGSVTFPLDIYNNLQDAARELEELKSKAVLAIKKEKDSLGIKSVDAYELIPGEKAKRIISEDIDDLAERADVASKLATERREKIIHLEGIEDKMEQWRKEATTRGFEIERLEIKLDRIRKVIGERASKKAKLKIINDIVGEM